MTVLWPRVQNRLEGQPDSPTPLQPFGPKSEGICRQRKGDWRQKPVSHLVPQDAHGGRRTFLTAQHTRAPVWKQGFVGLSARQNTSGRDTLSFSLTKNISSLYDQGGLQNVKALFVTTHIWSFGFLHVIEDQRDPYYTLHGCWLQNKHCFLFSCCHHIILQELFAERFFKICLRKLLKVQYVRTVHQATHTPNKKRLRMLQKEPY